MTVTASTLRQNVYRLLDEVIETGKPIEIERKGERLRIERPSQPGSKLSRLTRHACIQGDPEAIVHCDWSTEWEKAHSE